MLFFRQLQHLLPDGRAWRLTIESTLRQFFEGLSEVHRSTREFVDRVHEDRLPTTTRYPEMWEEQFGLVATASDIDRRAQLESAWQATGGQSPWYLQDIVRKAGFDVYIHEWWVPGSMPRVPRNPRDYTDDPLLGTVQCGEPLAQCGEPTAQCNSFLANEVGYIVNKNLTDVAPPAIPNDPLKWPYFVYWGGETFPALADVPAARREEFERLILKLCPTNDWLVTLINYV